MATVRCWALHGNVQRAIDYIVNEEKTDNGLLVESKNYPVSQSGLMWTAQEKFREDYTEDATNIVGYHFQQSWEAGSITPNEAMELSKQWIERITGGQHDYVLATHIDHADRHKNPHIHTHIIINPRNNLTGKKMQIFYKKDLPTFKEISNRINVEYGKSVIEQPKGQGKTYYEWLMENQGDSLKTVVAKTIDNLIPKVRDYDEFKQYLTKLGYEVEDGLQDNEVNHFDVTADISLISEELSTETSYFIRIPKTNDYISVPKTYGKWKDNDRTYMLRFDLEKEIVKYDANGNVKANIRSGDLQNYFDDKTRTDNGRQGLRIKPPYSKKFIRCHRIDENENGEGYSLNEVLERIENNGRFVADPEIINFLNKEEINKSDELNYFYEQAEIRTKWQNSKYYQMSKKERYVEYKTEEIQNRLQSIHERRATANDLISIEKLKEDRKSLQKQLKDLNAKLSKNEMYYEQINIDKLAGRLEASDDEITTFANENITPLQKMRLQLKEEISSLSLRINKAETKKKVIIKDNGR